MLGPGARNGDRRELVASVVADVGQRVEEGVDIDAVLGLGQPFPESCRCYA
jgi:hypothetical protein